MREEEAAKLAEQERLEQAEKRQQYIRYLCRTLAAEPDSSYDGKVSKLSFRLADGERVIRKFKDVDTLEVSIIGGITTRTSADLYNRHCTSLLKRIPYSKPNKMLATLNFLPTTPTSIALPSFHLIPEPYMNQVPPN